MGNFEVLLLQHRGPIERYVKFRIDNPQDAEDILQETYLTGFRKFDTLKDPSQFKFWMVSIAKNKCRDYYRKQYRKQETSLEELCELTAEEPEFLSPVQETMEQLRPQDRALLQLSYEQGMPQAQIAEKLQIPVGTVKSRLYTAKQHFKAKYPYPLHSKGDFTMKKMPLTMPEYAITLSGKAPFSVEWKEIMGWMIVPEPGNRLSWAMYDDLTGKRREYCDLEVVGKARVHGIDGVEIHSVEYGPTPNNSPDGSNRVERTLIAQLTDTHVRLLAESHTENGVKRFFTFLDEDAFLGNWGYGADNCGKTVHMEPKGIYRQEGDGFVCDEIGHLDMIGRYDVTIAGKTYDTVCVLDVESYDEGRLQEIYLDKDGNTILNRLFNRDDWAFKHFGKLWTEMFPDNQRLTVNGKTYVHWYDCMTSLIMDA
ncbi:MAG: RNA polymerase sigma factor [Oscillospiraceae bacterium]|nr:RNA polymerase sigma factor [Oscillospiraceae bacterium]